MDRPWILGIDPGFSGGIALLDNKKTAITYCYDSGTGYDLVTTLRVYAPEISMAYIEQVSAMPKQGVVSMFKFGKNYGFHLGVLASLQIPVKFVLPRVWQARLKCLTKGDKNVTKQKAQELFPSLKITHAIADALLIAEYGRQTEAMFL